MKPGGDISPGGIILPGDLRGDRAPQPDTLTIPLRFRRSSARVLDAIVDRLKSEGIATENITLFEQAADAARKGEPLMLRCDHVDEAKATAAAFTHFGIAEPTIGG